MKKFKFKQFEIQQKPTVFRVGTDGVLLGSLGSCEQAKNALEIGAGTGLISLMFAQRNPQLHITALDINEEAAQLAALNFAASTFSSRLQTLARDYNEFSAQQPFDFIFSNPPYFEAPEMTKDFIARQQAALTFEQLIRQSVKLLTPAGILSVILPSEAVDNFVKKAEFQGLILYRNICIYGIKGGKLRRNILEFSKQYYPYVSEDFVIEKAPREYSLQYRDVTKDFHPHF